MLTIQEESNTNRQFARLFKQACSDYGFPKVNAFQNIPRLRHVILWISTDYRHAKLQKMVEVMTDTLRSYSMLDYTIELRFMDI